MDSPADWLGALGLSQYADLFEQNEVDMATLRILTEEDLKELGIPFGPRKRIMAELSGATRPASEPKPASASAVSQAPTGERRQLTVLFCDLVDFSGIVNRVDPEVVQSMVQLYEDTCAACIARFEGFLFQRLGDGVVAFFGFPMAHEGEADRAIRAGLAMIEAFERLEVPGVGRLQVRIGIATGLVVVSTSDNTAVGEPMIMASRLQGVADSGSVVVADGVRALAAGAFEYADLGEQALKGIADPVRVFAVSGASRATSRFEAAAGARLSPLVGRDQEIQILLDRWSLGRRGEGQIVLVRGEAGVGKSRIISSLSGHLEERSVPSLWFHCSPYHVTSALYPIVSFVEHAVGFVAEDSASDRLDKLASHVDALGMSERNAHLLATALSLPVEDHWGALEIGPQRRKEETLEALAGFITATASSRPSVLFFEDVHWADPTTLELLDLLAGAARNLPALVIITYRPEFSERWREHGHVTLLDLSRLSRDDSRALVSRLTEGRELPPGLLEQITERTDGVPLFVEELTRSILEQGYLVEEGGEYRYRDSSEPVPIPSTLRDLLAARLDRIRGVKRIAQIGAVIGREFSYEMVAAVSPFDEDALRSALDELVESGLAFQHGTIPDARYTFKHALVQDAAYDSLLRTRRSALHTGIAHALEKLHPESRETQPELLARHYTAAGMPEEAAELWLRAGERALRSFSIHEATAHLQHGLEVVDQLPAGPARDARELELRTLLGPTTVALRGWADPQVGVALEPAADLVRSVDHHDSRVSVLNGVWVHSMVAGRLAESLSRARELLDAGAEHESDDLEICGHRAAMTSFFWLGDLLGARRHGDEIVKMYDADRHAHVVRLTNTDPLTGDGIYRCQFLWMLGYPDQAVAASLRNHEHARRRRHPFDLAFALTLGAQAFDFTYQPDELLRCAEEGATVGREHRISVMSDVLAEISRGIAFLRAGRDAEAVERLGLGIDRLERTGQRIWVPYLNALLSQAMGRVGDLEGAFELMARLEADIEARGERPHYAEVLRIKALLLLRQQRRTEAAEALRAAVAFAREQQARSWELRAATTLAELLADEDPSGAIAVLEPVYDWFTEGFDTHDLRTARAVLAGLGRRGGLAEPSSNRSAQT